MTNADLSKEQILLAIVPLQMEETRMLFTADEYKRSGDLQAAVRSYEQLVSACRNHLALAEMNNRLYPGSPFEIKPVVNPLLDALLIQADLYELLGDQKKAEGQREDAMRLSEQYLSQTEVLERHRQRATSLMSQGRFNEALAKLMEIRDQFQSHDGTLMDMANVTTDIAGTLEWLGDYGRAMEEARAARLKIKPLVSRNAPSMVNVLNAVAGGRLGEAQQQISLVKILLDLEQVEARCNRFLGNLEDAKKQFLNILPQVPAEGRVGIEYQLAALSVAAGAYEEGLACINRIEPLFTGLARAKLGTLWSLKAEAQLGLGKTQTALDTLEAAIPEIVHHRDMEALWHAYERKARVLVAQGKPDGALAAYRQAADTINGLRKASLGYRLDSTFLHDKMSVFAKAISLACDLGAADECCCLMEMIKSRGLTIMLSIPHSRQIPGLSGLELQVDKLSREIDGLDFAAYNAKTSVESEQIEKQRSNLLTVRARLLAQIRISDPRWRSLSEPVPFDLRQALDLLASRNQAALSLFFQSGQVVAVLLMDGGCTAERIDLSDHVRAALTSYQKNLQQESPKVEWFDPAMLGLEAADIVPRKLLQRAITARSLVIVPHGMLHLLPWAGMNYDGRPLFSFCPVGILPNLSCLLSLATRFSPAPKVALLGAPDYRNLPRVKELILGSVELKTVEDIYRPHGGVIDKPRKEETATEAAFRELADHADAAGGVLHMSCHGSFETGEPMHSGLLLADGVVDAAEIERRHLPYEDVVLSACHTGYRPTEVGGVPLSGDDVLGLPGAFLEAGVHSMLVSIPPAREDVTLEFMTVYHENRSRGVTPLAALQAAQKEMLSEYSAYRSCPYLWTGFTVYGGQ